jgi:hypothetical protein
VKKMGAQLAGYFETVTKEFGIKGRMKLALLTCTTSVTATEAADSPANIQKFEKAMAQIRANGTS